MSFSAAPREKLAQRTTSQNTLRASNCMRSCPMGYRQNPDTAPAALLEFVIVKAAGRGRVKGKVEKCATPGCRGVGQAGAWYTWDVVVGWCPGCDMGVPQT